MTLATQQGLRSSGRVWYIEGVGNIRSPEGEIGYIKSAALVISCSNGNRKAQQKTVKGLALSM